MTQEATPHSRPTIPTAEELAKLPRDGGDNWNRLVFEKSPYLQQHAANPVDWHPWGDEAFETARRLDKPVFLSVGYSTCHWCHVMEHESFEDPATAALLNDAFVCVKVDREERPDVDQVYMNVTMGMTGSGGWPMTVIMTADRKPFFAGTYFPKEGRYGRPGVADLVRHITALWKDDRSKLVEQADYIAREIATASRFKPGDTITTETLQGAFSDLRDRFDTIHGGFSHRPKFPVPHNFSFLLRYFKRTGDESAAAMVTHSLRKIRLGGVYDQVGLGLHRYSTDERWLLPHFEKMLYDQALFIIACTEASQALGEPVHRQTAEDTITYVLRDMTSPEGAFYSAEDADSEGVEGKFYVWSVDEVFSILGDSQGALFAKTYGFQEEGNFAEEATGLKSGENIPHFPKPPEDMAKLLKVDFSEFETRLAESRAKLFAVREKRVHPFKDDKVLTDWNGLMISALCRAGRAFEKPDYIAAARRAGDFALATLRTSDGRLLKRYRHGEAALPGHLEDYAYLSLGLLDLYEATFDAKYLKGALELTAVMREQFEDKEYGGFFQTATDGEQLIVRSKEAYDGALPSGNSVAALVLLRLARMTGDDALEASAEGVFTAFGQVLERQPSGFCQMMSAGEYARSSSVEIVLAGTPGDGDFEALRREVDRRFLPNAVVLHRPDSQDAAVLELIPALRPYGMMKGRATAYLCRNFACEAPTTDPAAFGRSLDRAAGKPQE
ncbi:DUF255 domain-containing protein [bacterium]|nr:DUF255 domain-containing protein [bacterium]